MKNLLLYLLVFIAVTTAWVADAAPLPLGVVIEFKGEPKEMWDLITNIHNDPLNKVTKCERASDTTIACVKVGPKLKAFMKKNAPKTVTWSIHPAAIEFSPYPELGCVFMSCPPPSGRYQYCHNTAPYTPCDSM